MRLAFGAAVVVILSATAGSAQDITLDGVARSVSLFSAIAHYCPSHVKVDTAEARKILSVYMQAGTKVEGEAAFKARLDLETTRRTKEVDITGPFQWCVRQKAFLQSQGDKTVFPP